MRAFLAVALLALSGCVSPEFVSSHADPPGGWPVSLFAPSPLWCAYGQGPFAWLEQSGDGWGKGASVSTIGRDGTVTMMRATWSWGSPPPMRQVRLVNISASEADVWLRAANVEFDGEDATSVITARGSPRADELASFCTRIVSEMPFVEERDDHPACDDGGTSVVSSWTTFGHHSMSAYCGGNSERAKSLLEAWFAFRDRAWKDIVG